MTEPLQEGAPPAPNEVATRQTPADPRQYQDTVDEDSRNRGGRRPRSRATFQSAVLTPSLDTRSRNCDSDPESPESILMDVQQHAGEHRVRDRTSGRGLHRGVDAKLLSMNTPT